MTANKAIGRTSTKREIQQFLARTESSRQRLLFALDATASRQPTWDRACHLQTKMFQATTALAGLSIQLCYYRGDGEFDALPWSDNSSELQRSMQSVRCLGGYSQIARVLCHALGEHQQQAIRAVVFVGDAIEEEPAELYRLAGQFGLCALPLFVFQEGHDREVARVFGELARLSQGAHCQFDEHSEGQLRDLLTAVACYTAGGRAALEQLKHNPVARHLLATLPRS